MGTLKAPADLVLVEAVYEGTAEGSKVIVVHDRDKEYIGNFHGIVVSVGPKYKFKKEIKVGDKIHFKRHEGHVINHEGKKYLSLQSRWINASEK